MIDCMPQQFVAFADETLAGMTECVSRIVTTLRWRLNRPQGTLPVSWFGGGVQFSLDKEKWHQMPSMMGASLLHDQDKIDFTPAIASEVVRAVQDKETEPLAHALFREAWPLRFSNRKSSLLVGFTAAEIGIKQHISVVVPHTEYLMRHIPSPPISKLLDYLDQLPSKIARQNPRSSLPDSIKKPLKKMMETRNEIAHRGRPDRGDRYLSLDDLEQQLYAVRDLLWLLDYHAGYEWALGYVRREIRSQLGQT